jgi:hypothetical protein
VTLLTDKEILVRSGSAFDFDDPLMRHWVSTHALPDVGIHPATL